MNELLIMAKEITWATPRRRLATVTSCMLATTAIVAYVTGMIAEYVALLVLWLVGGVIYLFGFRRRRAAAVTPEPSQAPLDEDRTMEIPILDTSVRPPGKQRQLVDYTDGTKRLVIHKRSVLKRRIFGGQVSWSTSEIALRPGLLMNAKLARQSSFAPIPTESEALIFTRLHWWSHAPKQLALFAVALGVTGVSLYLGFTRTGIEGWMIGLAWIVLMVILAGAYLIVWVPWYYTWFVVTDRRIILAYTPPLWLAGTPAQSSPVKNILTSNHIDQTGIHAIINWILGLRWISITQYGIISADTAGDKGDEWLNEGIAFMRHPALVKDIIDELAIGQSTRTEGYQSDDADRQNAQIDLLRQILHAVGGEPENEDTQANS